MNIVFMQQETKNFRIKQPFVIWLLSTPQRYINIFKYTIITEIFLGRMKDLTLIYISLNICKNNDGVI